jgi:hypothetical protein
MEARHAAARSAGESLSANGYLLLEQMLQVLRQGKTARFGQCRETSLNLGREFDSHGHGSFLVDRSKSIAYAAKYSTVKPSDHLKHAGGIRPCPSRGPSFNRVR